VIVVNNLEPLIQSTVFSPLFSSSYPIQDILGWGENEMDCMGETNDQKEEEEEEYYGDNEEMRKIQSPQQVPIPRLFAGERIVTISCSPNHTLMLTNFGSVLGMGNNSEGALGIGFDPTFNSNANILSTPTRITLFEENSIRICEIAAGGGLVGSHSLFLSHPEGVLYSCGVGMATGQVCFHSIQFIFIMLIDSYYNCDFYPFHRVRTRTNFILIRLSFPHLPHLR